LFLQAVLRAVEFPQQLQQEIALELKCDCTGLLVVLHRSELDLQN
jgi:hypothetical protein